MIAAQPLRRPLDIKLTPTDHGMDWAIENNDLALEYGLRTMILVCLFTDARYEPGLTGEKPPSELDVRGWWADSPGDRWGSRLWIIRKLNNKAAEIARSWATEALQPLITEGYAESVDVTVTRVGSSSLGLCITVTRGAARQWESAWSEELGNPGSIGVKLIVT